MITTSSCQPATSLDYYLQMATTSSEQTDNCSHRFIVTRLEYLIDKHIYNGLRQVYREPTGKFLGSEVNEFLVKYAEDETARSRCNKDMRTGKTELIGSWIRASEWTLKQSIDWIWEMGWTGTFGDARATDLAGVLQVARNTRLTFSHQYLQWTDKFTKELEHWETVDQKLRAEFDRMCVNWISHFVVRAVGQFAGELGIELSPKYQDKQERFRQAIEASETELKDIYGEIDAEALSAEIEYLVKVRFKVTWPSLTREVRIQAWKEQYDRHDTFCLMEQEPQEYVSDFPHPAIEVLDQFLGQANVQGLSGQE